MAIAFGRSGGEAVWERKIERKSERLLLVKSSLS